LRLARWVSWAVVEALVGPRLKHWLSGEPAAAATEEAAATEAQEEAPAEAGLVDIASILGVPTVTVVRSSL
jgi:p-aminobenzoyl-glutamate transporter AbgT